MSNSYHNSVTFQNLSVGYKQESGLKILLRNLNFSLSKGSLTAIIGSNGSGKSTLLRTIMRQLPVLDGTIKLFGNNILTIGRNELAKSLSFVSTEKILVQNLTVFQLVAMGRFPYTNWLGTLNTEDKTIILKSLEQVNLLHLKNNNITEISDGELQRALIARTLAQDTPIILLDEPTSYLDLGNKFEIIHLLQKMSKEQGKTILYSTHDINIAMQESDKLWMINDKSIIDGSPEDLVLNNTLKQFLEKDKIEFNEANGQLEIKRHFNYKVNLTGNSNLSYWTEKALNRNGIEVIKKGIGHNEKILQIEIFEKNGQKTWCIQGIKNTKEYTSIAEMIESIKKLL